MKRLMIILLATLSTAVCSAGTDAMSNSKVRKETRFLTDKMAYELNLNTEQYNDVYEINYDFISGVRYLMDDVLRGYEWALDRYYDYLDVRNDDLRWVLSSPQYGRFIQADYFYRPIYTSGNRWHFRVYINYTNHNHYYFPRPYHYRTYAGGHYRTHYNNASYYRGRYKHQHYSGSYRIRNNKTYTTHRRSDFGSVNIRPGSSRQPARTSKDDVYTTRRSNSSSKRATTTGSSSSRATNNSTRSNSSSTRSNNSNSSSTRSNNSNSSTRNNGSSTRSKSETKSNSNSSRRNSSRTNSERKENNSSSVRSSSGSSSRSSGTSTSRSSGSTRSTRSSGDRK